MVLVLAGAAVFVYTRLAADLNEGVDKELGARLSYTAAGARPVRSEQSFTQLLTRRGGVVEGASSIPAPAVTPAEAAKAGERPRELERRVPGVDGTATRVLVQRAEVAGRERVVVVGVSLDDRDEALRGVLASFLIGGAAAVLLASGIGYGLATAGLAPVEAMRRRASHISLGGKEERLPLPPAHDEVRRLGETLNEMLDRMRAAFDRERRFVADASHELRTPLAVIKAELEGVLRSEEHSPQARESLVAATEETDQLAQLAEDLLLIARAVDAGMPVRKESVAVRELLERTRERFADRARERGRTIDVVAPDDLRARFDPLRLRQALGNLVDNALRHGEGRIELSARQADGGVELAVSDEGEGFSEDFVPRAFERFAREDGARTRGGAGLGLAIVAAIAEAHGGSAEIAARGGRASSVRLLLPAAPVSAPARGGYEPRVEHEERADELERETDKLQGENERVGRAVEDTRDDWDKKKQSESPPGAMPEEDAYGSEEESGGRDSDD